MRDISGGEVETTRLSIWVGYLFPMAAIDIVCPDCGRSDTVEKVGIGQYRCRECESGFGRDDILGSE